MTAPSMKRELKALGNLPQEEAARPRRRDLRLRSGRVLGSIPKGLPSWRSHDADKPVFSTRASVPTPAPEPHLGLTQASPPQSRLSTSSPPPPSGSPARVLPNQHIPRKPKLPPPHITASPAFSRSEDVILPGESDEDSSPTKRRKTERRVHLAHTFLRNRTLQITSTHLKFWAGEMARLANTPGPPRPRTPRHSVIDLTLEIPETNARAARPLSVKSGNARPPQNTGKQRSKSMAASKIVEIPSSEEEGDDDHTVVPDSDLGRKSRMSVAPEGSTNAAGKRHAAGMRSSRAVTMPPTADSAPAGHRERLGGSNVRTTTRLDPKVTSAAQAERDIRSPSVYAMEDEMAAPNSAPPAPARLRSASALDQRSVSPETEELRLEALLSRINVKLANATFGPDGEGTALVGEMFKLTSRLTTLRRERSKEVEAAAPKGPGAKRQAPDRDSDSDEPTPRAIKKKKAKIQRRKVSHNTNIQPHPSGISSGRSPDTGIVPISATVQEVADAVRRGHLPAPKVHSETVAQAGTKGQAQRPGSVNEASLAPTQGEPKSRKQRRREQQALAASQSSTANNPQQQDARNDPSQGSLEGAQRIHSSPCENAASAKQQKAKNQAMIPGASKTLDSRPVVLASENQSRAAETNDGDGPSTQAPTSSLDQLPNRFREVERPIAEALKRHATKANSKDLNAPKGAGVDKASGRGGCPSSEYDMFFEDYMRLKTSTAAKEGQKVKIKQESKGLGEPSVKPRRQAAARQTAAAKSPRPEQVIDLCQTTDGDSSSSSSSDEEESPTIRPAKETTSPKQQAGKSTGLGSMMQISSSWARRLNDDINAVAGRRNEAKGHAGNTAEAFSGTSLPALPQAPARVEVSDTTQNWIFSRKNGKSRFVPEAPSRVLDSSRQRSKSMVPGSGVANASQQASSSSTVAPKAPDHRTVQVPKNQDSRSASAPASSSKPSKKKEKEASKGIKEQGNGGRKENSVQQAEKPSKRRKRASSVGLEDVPPNHPATPSRKTRGQSEHPAKKPKLEKCKNADAPRSQPASAPKIDDSQSSGWGVASHHFNEIFNITRNLPSPAKSRTTPVKAHTTLPASENVPSFEFKPKKAREAARKKKAIEPQARAPLKEASDAPLKGHALVGKGKVESQKGTKARRETAIEETSSDTSDESSSESESSPDVPLSKQSKAFRSQAARSRAPTAKKKASGDDRVALHQNLPKAKTNSSHKPLSATSTMGANAGLKREQSESTSSSGDSSSDENEPTSSNCGVYQKPTTAIGTKGANAGHGSDPSESTSSSGDSSSDEEESTSSNCRVNRVGMMVEPAPKRHFQVPVPSMSPSQQLLSEHVASQLSPTHAEEGKTNEEPMLSTQAEFERAQAALWEDSPILGQSQATPQAPRSSSQNKGGTKLGKGSSQRENEPVLNFHDDEELLTTQALIDGISPFTPPSSYRPNTSPANRPTDLIRRIFPQKTPSKEGDTGAPKSQGKSKTSPDGSKRRGPASQRNEGASEPSSSQAATARPLNRVSTTLEDTLQSSASTPAKKRKVAWRHGASEPRSSPPALSTPRNEGKPKSSLKVGKGKKTSASSLFSKEESAAVDDAVDFLGGPCSLAEELHKAKGSSSSS